MEAPGETFIKQREIAFAELHPDPNQAQTAASLLADVPGVRNAKADSAQLLRVSYHVLEVSLQQIEEALTAAGFHLSSKLLYRIRRALYYYTEETQRANHGCPHGDSNCTQKVFIRRYQTMDHGCRDNRPEHWRRYL